MVDSDKSKMQEKITLILEIAEECEIPKVRHGIRQYVGALQRHLDRWTTEDQKVVHEVLPRVYAVFEKYCLVKE